MGRRRGVVKIAQQSLVIDASIGVKWFSRRDEADLVQADLLLNSQKDGVLIIYVPELFYYEVANVLTHKTNLSNEGVESSIKSLWDLGLRVMPLSEELLAHSVRLARLTKITVYDACYGAFAANLNCPLITANPRHQGQNLGCQVIPLKDWKGFK